MERGGARYSSLLDSLSPKFIDDHLQTMPKKPQDPGHGESVGIRAMIPIRERIVVIL